MNMADPGKTSADIACTLCRSGTSFFYYDENYNRHYYQCSRCRSVMLHPADYIDTGEEKLRYTTHNNDVQDPGYQKFVQPVADYITGSFAKEHKGLDYGCGPGPVITHLLRKEGYAVTTYDPYFDNRPEVLQRKYDYIFCCEVIEHFHEPREEFMRLRAMLKPGGQLICKTDPFTDDTNFENWYYKNDETHVIFYHPDAFEFIKDYAGFSSLRHDNRLIVFGT